MDWQPIETAPKDRDVLLFAPDDDPQIVVGYFVSNPDDEHSDYWQYREQLVADVQGLIEGATHWAPMDTPI